MGWNRKERISNLNDTSHGGLWCSRRFYGSWSMPILVMYFVMTVRVIKISREIWHRFSMHRNQVSLFHIHCRTVLSPISFSFPDELLTKSRKHMSLIKWQSMNTNVRKLETTLNQELFIFWHPELLYCSDLEYKRDITRNDRKKDEYRLKIYFSLFIII